MYKQTVLAILHRGSKVLWSRRYKNINNAMRKAVEVAMVAGQPRDVIEFSRIPSGIQIGSVKLHATGQMSCAWTADAQILDFTPTCRVSA